MSQKDGKEFFLLMRMGSDAVDVSCLMHCCLYDYLKYSECFQWEDNAGIVDSLLQTNRLDFRPEDAHSEHVQSWLDDRIMRTKYLAPQSKKGACTIPDCSPESMKPGKSENLKSDSESDSESDSDS